MMARNSEIKINIEQGSGEVEPGVSLACGAEVIRFATGISLTAGGVRFINVLLCSHIS